MYDLEIIVPVKNESETVAELAHRINGSLKAAKIKYRITFIDDHSTDSTIYEVNVASKTYPIKLLIKKGAIGKAYSILEAAREADAPLLAMIDGDLQYPPEALPEMYKLASKNGIAVANRKKHNTSFLRKLGSKVNKLVFERLLNGFNCDTQSGLKVFKKEIIDNLNEKDVTPWTLDMPLLRTGLELGYKIATVDIEFADRKKGESKIRFIRASAEIAKASVTLKFRKPRIYQLNPDGDVHPVGAGVAYKGKRFITHTLLPHHLSALNTASRKQKTGLFLGSVFLLTLFVINLKATAIVLVALLSLIYFIDLLFTLRVLLKSLHFPPEIKVSGEELKAVDGKDLPVYSILCPLYKEKDVLPQFIDALTEIDWPKDKLDVLLLLEEDDKETIGAAYSLNLPDYVRVLVVPHSLPKTKPKACNFGLAYAKGEFLVIYDAEDRPDPLQLKKAYIAFSKLEEKVVCLQCKLNYYNPNHNLLTRLFTAEYSLWFDLVLPGLQSIESVIPLGGTSNHFKTDKLRELHGWDPFNVTEDCDLGARLFKKGFKTALVDSTTYEEANSRIKSWIKQRSRWIKGYIQTYLVHMRDPIKFHREFGTQALVFQLVVGMRMVFILVNPLLWLATLSYFVLYAYVGPAIEALYPAPVFYIAVLSLVFGNFIYFYNYMIACAKKGQWNLVKFVYLVPLYWLATSIAAVVAFYQLLVKPHYWEKTQHGLHLAKTKTVVESEQKPASKFTLSPQWIGGGTLVASSVFVNFSNFLYNAYLGRKLSLEEFGTVSLISGIYAFISIISHSLGKTVNYKSAYLFGKFKQPVKSFISVLLEKAVIMSLLFAVLWVLSSVFLSSFFNTGGVLPFWLFSPVLLVFLIGSINNGFLMGNFKFIYIAIVALTEAIVKLGSAYFLVNSQQTDFIYVSIPASLSVSTLFGFIFVSKIKEEKSNQIADHQITFPKGFYITSLLTGIAAVSFLTLDVILAKHYLNPTQAGQYALLSLAGKIIFFLSGLTSQFLVPLLAKSEGERKNSAKVFYKLFWIVTAITAVGYVLFGLFGFITIPLLFGQKALAIVNFLPLYGMAMVYLVISSVFVTYHQIKKHYIFPVTAFIFSCLQVLGIVKNHASVSEIVFVVSGLSLIQLASILILHFFYDKIYAFGRNLRELYGLFEPLRIVPARNGKLNILFFNWRDMKHVWSGGAEVYAQEMAKRWVREGHKVTLFCGNDGKNKMDDKVEGVQVIRRGGFYTIYIWACLYYLFKLRGKFDIVVDAENGIPFFTPLYVEVPKILLIHHVHQDYLKERAPFPFSHIAKLLESYLMPLAYKNSRIVTISESSKKDIRRIGIRNNDIEIINPGINRKEFRRLKKSSQPTFVYIGRLKPYKNVDIAIKAMALLKNKHTDAKLIIAGRGEAETYLKKLTGNLELSEQVEFLGFIPEARKPELLATSWASVQPSSFEGWGITVIEANASGTPVIASRIKGLTDSVVEGQTGILVPVKNEKSLADAMDGLISYEKYRSALSDNAYLWSKNFSWDKSAKEFLKIIINVVNVRRQLMYVRKLTLAET